jgi:hypothetical protein
MRIGSLFATGLTTALALAGSAGCSALGPTTRTGVFEGHYLTSFEVSSFVPCGQDAAPGYAAGWWLESDPAAQFGTRYAAALGPSAGAGSSATGSPSPRVVPRAVHVRFEGTVETGDSNGYGHLNGYRAQVQVHRVLSMDTDGRCPGGSGPSPS